MDASSSIEIYSQSSAVVVGVGVGVGVARTDHCYGIDIIEK